MSHTKQLAEKAVTLKEGLAEIESGMRKLTSNDMNYSMACLVNAYHLLLTKYAPFKAGDRVQLKTAPVIDEHKASGWMGARHFLVKGAVATVDSVTVGKEGDLACHLIFDDESWIDSKGTVTPSEKKHTFGFGIDHLEAAGHLEPTDEAIDQVLLSLRPALTDVVRIALRGVA